MFNKKMDQVLQGPYLKALFLVGTFNKTQMSKSVHWSSLMKEDLAPLSVSQNSLSATPVLCC